MTGARLESFVVVIGWWLWWAARAAGCLFLLGASAYAVWCLRPFMLVGSLLALFLWWPWRWSGWWSAAWRERPRVLAK